MLLVLYVIFPLTPAYYIFDLTVLKRIKKKDMHSYIFIFTREN